LGSTRYPSTYLTCPPERRVALDRLANPS